MLTNTVAPPTDQRAGVRPISFVLQNGSSFGAPVTLKIRPSDLSRQESTRVSVHQTLGRDTSGWADNFGAGLPSCTISGNTGWRSGAASGMDGAAAFEALNNIVMHDFHAAKQDRVNQGLDPADCKLLFIDTLDNFCWNVVAPVFELRRNRSNPLLFMYNIRLQAISTDVDNPLISLPFSASLPAGLRALGSLISKLEGFAGSIINWVSTAVGVVDSVLKPIANTINAFYQLSQRVFNAVNTAVSAVVGGVNSVANRMIGMATDIAKVGTNIFRTISTITSLPGNIKSSLMRVAGAFNEAFCIFRNSLKPKKLYEDYDNLYGASNCSSTSGGRPASMYANTNVFSMLQSDPSGIAANNAALNSISELNRADAAFTMTGQSSAVASQQLTTMAEHVEVINDGVTVSDE